MSPRVLRDTVSILCLGLLLQYYTTIPALFFLNTFFVQNVPASEAFLEKSFPSNVCKLERDPKGLTGKGFCWYIIYRYIIISAITLIMLIGFYRRPHISYQVVTRFILLYYIVKVGRMIVCILFTLSALKFELLSCLPSACF